MRGYLLFGFFFFSVGGEGRLFALGMLVYGGVGELSVIISSKKKVLIWVETKCFVSQEKLLSDIP